MKITTFLKSSVILYFLMLYTGESLSVPVTLDWQVQLPSYNTEFIAADDKIFANDGKTLSAICAAGGQTEKTFELPVECVRNLKTNLSYFWAINSKRIVYLDKDGFLSLLEAKDFSVVRRQKIFDNTAGVTINELIVSENHIGIAVEKNGGVEILIYDLLSGEKKWALHEVDSKPVRRAAIEKDNLLVFTDLVLFVFNIKDKKLLWQADFRISHPDFIRFATAGNLYLIKEGTTSIKAFKRATGELAWMHLLSYCSGFVADEKTLYVSSNKKVFAMDAETGSIRWEYLMENAVLPNMFFITGNLLAGRIKNMLFILNKNTGKPGQFYSIPHNASVFVSPDSICLTFDRTLFTLSNNSKDVEPPVVETIWPSEKDTLPPGHTVVVHVQDKNSGLDIESVYAEINGLKADTYVKSRWAAGHSTIYIQNLKKLPAGRHICYVSFADYHGNTAKKTFHFTTGEFPVIKPSEVSTYTFRGGPSHSGFNPEKFTSPYYAKGFISIPESQESIPVFTDKYVFVYRIVQEKDCINCYIEQIDRETLRIKRRFKGEPGFTVKENQLVYFDSFSSRLVLHDFEQNREIWKSNIALGTFTLNSIPVVTKDRIYVNSHDFILHAFDLHTGRLLWIFATNHVGAAGIPAAICDNVFICGQTGNTADPYIYCIDAFTGKEKWRFPGSVEDINRVYRHTEKTQTPNYRQSNLVVDNDILFVTLGSTIYAISVETGKDLWSFSTGMYTSNMHAPAVKDGVVYYAFSLLNRGKAMRAFDGQTGRIIWERIMDDVLERYEHFNDSPIIAGQYLLASTSSGKLFVLNCETGSITETIHLGPGYTANDSPYMAYLNGDLWISGKGAYMFFQAGVRNLLRQRKSN